MVFSTNFLSLISLVIALLVLQSHAQSQGAFNANHELLIAARDGKVGRIIQVLDHGAYVEAKNNNGVCALIFAANNGHLKAVEVLLDRRAHIEARSNDGKTPLIWAALWGHLDVVAYLIERGADVNAYDRQGMTSLMSAVLNGHKTVAEELITQGAEVTRKNFYNGTALTIARIKGSAELVDLLEPYFPEEESSNPYFLLLKHAIQGAVQQFKRLLAYVRYYTGLHSTISMTEDL